jgi:hypothetical protein
MMTWWKAVCGNGGEQTLLWPDHPAARLGQCLCELDCTVHTAMILRGSSWSRRLVTLLPGRNAQRVPSQWDHLSNSLARPLMRRWHG